MKIAKWIGIVLVGLILVAVILLKGFSFIITKLPSFTGFPFSSHNYLVLFQNNYELRPTGGFISTYGVLKFRHGIFWGIDFGDVYGDVADHPYVEPPKAMGQLLADKDYKGYTFRDTNFDPDFTVAKDEIIKFYNINHPEIKIDGVIAADFTALENLVALYEPLKIDDYEFTKQNLFESLSSIVSDIDRHDEETLAGRKNIASSIVKKVITRTVLLPWRVRAASDVMLQAFDEKHMLASFNQSGLQKAFAKRGWDGSLPNGDAGDYLAVNNANYGGMKSNRYLEQDVIYELNVMPNHSVEAKVTVNLAHYGNWNVPLSGKYKGYLRIFYPGGMQEQILGIEPGDTVSYTYSYVLPESVWADGVYNLRLVKQPGTLANRYRVVVRVPSGESVKGEDFVIKENVALYDTNLLSDQNLSFELVPDTNPPRVIAHDLISLNQIEIEFNEWLSAALTSNLFNYEVIDLDKKNSNKTDSLKVSEVRVEGSKVIITTTGMTVQPTERYQVLLKNVQDLKGNTIVPNLRKLTVVQ